MILHVAASALWIGAGCSPRAIPSGKTSLDSAIAFYIDGDFQKSEALLVKLAPRLESQEDRRLAYLYLGRCYLALGNYSAAAGAFMMGKSPDGVGPFEDYLLEIESRLRGSPERIRARHAITRAELACLMDAELAGTFSFETGILNELPAPELRPGDVEDHWAGQAVERVLDRGWMHVLPDGNFHPDEALTRASFYVIIRRLLETVGARWEGVDVLFPGGLRGAIRGTESDGGGDGLGWRAPDHAVSGRGNAVSGLEAVTVLRTVAEEARP